MAYIKKPLTDQEQAEREAFLNWIEAELDRRKMNQSKLARAGQMSTALVSMVLSRKSGYSDVFIKGIARAFDLPEVEIFQRAGIVAGAAIDSGLPAQVAELVAKLPADKQGDVYNFAKYLYDKLPDDNELNRQAGSLTSANRKQAIQTGQALAQIESSRSQFQSGGQTRTLKKSPRFVG